MLSFAPCCLRMTPTELRTRCCCCCNCHFRLKTNVWLLRFAASPLLVAVLYCQQVRRARRDKMLISIPMRSPIRNLDTYSVLTFRTSQRPPTRTSVISFRSRRPSVSGPSEQCQPVVHSTRVQDSRIPMHRMMSHRPQWEADGGVELFGYYQKSTSATFAWISAHCLVFRCLHLLLKSITFAVARVSAALQSCLTSVYMKCKIVFMASDFL